MHRGNIFVARGIRIHTKKIDILQYCGYYTKNINIIINIHTNVISRRYLLFVVVIRY